MNSTFIDNYDLTLKVERLKLAFAEKKYNI